MKRSSNYNTRQREAVLEYIMSHGDTHVTVAQIVSHFMSEKYSIGRTTIYRHLDKLIREGKLRKYNVDGITGACYQYVNDVEIQQKHLLLKCEGCGELIHLDCDELNEIHQHIYRDHTFMVNTTKTVFYGKCGDCIHNSQ